MGFSCLFLEMGFSCVNLEVFLGFDYMVFLMYSVLVLVGMWKLSMLFLNKRGGLFIFSLGMIGLDINLFEWISDLFWKMKFEKYGFLFKSCFFLLFVVFIFVYGSIEVFLFMYNSLDL